MKTTQIECGKCGGHGSTDGCAAIDYVVDCYPCGGRGVLVRCAGCGVDPDDCECPEPVSLDEQRARIAFVTGRVMELPAFSEVA